MITAEALRKAFNYDPATGKLTWRESGREAGAKAHSGYRRVGLHYHDYWAHRIIWAWWHGDWPEGVIDHIDQDGSNNRIENLRTTNRSGNAKNMRRSIANKSGVTGVCFCNRTKTWIVQIKDGGVRHHLGYFKDFDAAVASRKMAECEFGYSKHHGSPA